LAIVGRKPFIRRVTDLSVLFAVGKAIPKHSSNLPYIQQELDVRKHNEFFAMDNYS